MRPMNHHEMLLKRILRALEGIEKEIKEMNRKLEKS